MDDNEEKICRKMQSFKKNTIKRENKNNSKKKEETEE